MWEKGGRGEEQGKGVRGGAKGERPAPAATEAAVNVCFFSLGSPCYPTLGRNPPTPTLDLPSNAHAHAHTHTNTRASPIFSSTVIRHIWNNKGVICRRLPLLSATCISHQHPLRYTFLLPSSPTPIPLCLPSPLQKTKQKHTSVWESSTRSVGPR